MRPQPQYIDPPGWEQPQQPQQPVYPSQPQPAGIPQQGRYPQPDAYPQQVSQPALNPHPNLVPYTEPYPSVQPQSAGGGPAEDSPAGAGNAAGVAPGEPPGSPAAPRSGDPARTVGSARTGKNSFATAGAVTSFVPVVGLVLAAAGLVQSRGRGVGKATARAGIVLSLAFTAAWGAAGYYAYESTVAKATDPGCVSADADFLGFSTRLQRDASTMAGDAGSSGGARSPEFTAAVRDYQVDLAKLVSDFDVDSAKSGASSAKSAIEAVGADLTGLDSGFGDLTIGDYAAAANLIGLNARLISDFQHMEEVCTTA